MTKPTFTRPLSGTKSVEEGDSLILEVEVESPDDVHFEWRRNANQVVLDTVGAAGQTYQIADPTPAHAGKYTVSAWRGDGRLADDRVPGGECEVKVGGDEPQEPPVSPLEWDGKFAGQVLRYAAAAGALMVALIALVAAQSGSISWTVAVGLLAIAAVLGAAAFAVALIDLRGRARAAGVVADNARGLGADTLKATADVLKAWGGLGLASALLALVAIALIGATVIGYRSLPDPAAASPSASASSSASASASASASGSSTPSPTRS